MRREVTEAHYLHERSGLEAVLRAPVSNPTVLAWLPRREQLLAANREGQLVSVDPVLGTRVVAEGLGEAAVLEVSPDGERYLTLTRQGGWQIGSIKGEVMGQGKHDFLGSMDAFFAGPYVVMVGDTVSGRVLVVLHDGTVRTRARIPKDVVAALDPRGRPLLCRSTSSGLAVVPLGRDARFPKVPATAHRLRVSGTWILGFTPTGVCVWSQEGGAPRSMRLPDPTAGDVSVDGSYVGLGTRTGAVALARIDRIDKRIRPDLVRAFDSPVTAAAFSKRGRWLATAAESLRLWTWED